MEYRPQKPFQLSAAGMPPIGGLPRNQGSPIEILPEYTVTHQARYIDAIGRRIIYIGPLTDFKVLKSAEMSVRMAIRHDAVEKRSSRWIVVADPLLRIQTRQRRGFLRGPPSAQEPRYQVSSHHIPPPPVFRRRRVGQGLASSRFEVVPLPRWLWFVQSDEL